MKKLPLLALSTVATLAISGAAVAQNDYVNHNATATYNNNLSYENIDITTKSNAHVSNISFITGGIGEEEQTQFKNARSDYNTRMLFTDRTSGAYLANVKVDVMDKAGNLIFTNVSEGPYMYMDLPKGSYTVKTSFKGTEQTRKINISQNASKNLHFLWDTAI